MSNVNFDSFMDMLQKNNEQINKAQEELKSAGSSNFIGISDKKGTILPLGYSRNAIGIYSIRPIIDTNNSLYVTRKGGISGWMKNPEGVYRKFDLFKPDSCGMEGNPTYVRLYNLIKNMLDREEFQEYWNSKSNSYFRGRAVTDKSFRCNIKRSERTIETFSFAKLITSLTEDNKKREDLWEPNEEKRNPEGHYDYFKWEPANEVRILRSSSISMYEDIVRILNKEANYSDNKDKLLQGFIGRIEGMGSGVFEVSVKLEQTYTQSASIELRQNWEITSEDLSIAQDLSKIGVYDDTELQVMLSLAEQLNSMYQ